MINNIKDNLSVIVSVIVFVGFFAYIQHSSQVTEELKVEKLYRERCKSDSIINARIDGLNGRIKELERIHSHKLHKK